MNQNPNTKTSRKIVFTKKKNRIERYRSLENYMEKKNFPLHKYQKKGVDWMLKRELVGYNTKHNKISGGLLCDEPGLGKTIQTCATLYCNPLKYTLLILPKSVVQQWIDTIKKILPSEKIYLYHGANRCKTVAELKLKKFQILITTYGMLYDRTKKNDFTLLHNFGNWDRIILDEAHIIRNKKSKISQSICSLKGSIRWGLTGTPVQNSDKDLFSLYKFLEIPPNYFKKKCIDTINKNILIRRTKDEFKHLSIKFPNLNQIDYSLEFISKEERNLYDKIQKNLTNNYLNIIENSDKSVEALALLELLLRLRQVSIHPQIVINSLNRKFKSNIPKFTNNSTKINKLIDIIHSTKDEYCLVFCYFKDEIKLIGEQLKLKNIGYNIYDGSTKFREREQILKMYPPKKLLDQIWVKNHLSKNIIDNIKSHFPKVLLIQINAGGIGLNLQQFSQLFITSPNWNPSNEIQAIARAHRLGQDKIVNVHRFLLYDQYNKFSTIDEHIMGIQIGKRSIMTDILKDERYINSGVVNDFSQISNRDLRSRLLNN